MLSPSTSAGKVTNKGNGIILLLSAIGLMIVALGGGVFTDTCSSSALVDFYY